MKTRVVIPLPTRKTERQATPIETVLAESPFLKGLSSWHVQVLADCAMQTEFAGGQLIFREGDIANRFYLIQGGTVALESRGDDCGPVPIQTLGAGDVLGWSWLFPPYSWQFDARAVEPVKMIFFYGTRLREQCEEDHELGHELIKRMAAVMMQRLQATRRQLMEVSSLALRSQNLALRTVFSKCVLKAMLVA